MGSVANIVTTSIELGRNAILTWYCTTAFKPLFWATFSSVIHIIAAASYVIARLSSRTRKSPRRALLTLALQEKSRNDDLKSKSKQRSRRARSQNSRLLSSWLTVPIRALRRETTICANQQRPHYDVGKARVRHLAIFLNIVAGYFGFIHISFGIIVFSSLQFVSILIKLAGLATSKGEESEY